MMIAMIKRWTVLVTVAIFLASPTAALGQGEKPAKKLKPYPLKVCAVSDEKLGSMGAEYVFEHQGREIKLCCKSCLKEFKKDPAKYIKKIDQAEKKAAK